jgi:CRP-like cAMP-binding protein
MIDPAILKKIDLFEELGPEELSKLTEISKRETYNADEIIFYENEDGHGMYIVEKGQVKITKNISLNVDKTLMIVDTGGIFGEMSIIDQGRRSASAVAAGECGLLFISKADFDSLIIEQPAIGLKIFTKLANIVTQRLRMTTEAYKDSIIWGLEVSGAASLNFDKLIQDNVDLEVECLNGKTVRGRLLKVDRSVAGYDIAIKDSKETLFVIPYHAISHIAFDVSDKGRLLQIPE